MTGAPVRDGTVRVSGALPAMLGAAAAAAVGLAMWASDVPWTLTLDAGVSFLGQTVPAFREWAAGRVPEWSDLLWGGFPLLAEPTTAALYPPHALVHLITRHHPLRFFDAALALHVGLLAAGSAMLLRELRAGAPAVVLAAVVAVLSPIGHGNALANFAGYGAIAWLPWILTTAERLAQPAPVFPHGMLLLGWCGLAAQVLVGMPEHAVYSGVVAGLWIAVRRTGLPVGARATRIALLAAGGIALSAPQSLATLAYLPATTRSGEAVLSELGSMWISDALGLLVPGRRMGGVTGFFGVATVALAGAAVATRRAGAAPLVGIAIVAFLLSLGPQVGLYGWLHQLPPFHLFRAPVKLFAYAELPTVCAAALGADALRRRVAGLGPAIAVAVGLAALLEHVAFVAIDEPPILRGMYRTAPRPDVVEHLAAVPALRAATPDTPAPLVLDTAPPLGGGYAGSLGALVGVSSLHPGGISLLPIPHRALLYTPLTAWLATCLGVRYAIVPPERCAPQAARWKWREVAATADFCVLANPDAPQPFAVLRRAHAVSSVDRMLMRMRRRPRGPVPVVAPVEAVRDLAEGYVVGRQRRPGHVELVVTSGRRALVLVRKSLVAGWHVLVDGTPVEPYPAAGLYFAVPVTTGVHQITLTYRAPGFRMGVGVALAWLAGFGIWLACRRWAPTAVAARHETTAPHGG